MRTLVTNSFCLILIFLFCFINPAESINPGQRVGKEHIKVSEVEVVRARFGSGPDEVGITTPKEANPEGPMSFALGSGGEIYILDQINLRVQVFKDRKRIRAIPIPVKTFVDIDLTPDNKVVLLDNLVRKAVYLLDPQGKVLNIVPLEGRLIPNAAAVTGIYSRRGEKWLGIWAEVEERSVRIAALDGAPDRDRISVPGKFSFDGRRLIRANKIGDATAAIYRSEEDTFSKWDEYTVSFEMFIVHLLGIWDDQKGRVYLGTFLEDVDKQQKRTSSNEIVVLSPHLKELGRVKLFVQQLPHEIYRSIRISSDGHIFQMALDDRGVFIRRYKFFRE